MSAQVRVGVVGGGLIAQAIHLPNLAKLADQFIVTAIADPSRRVREALASQYHPARSYEDWRDLLDREELDAVVVCSPHATHAAVVLAALDRDLHVLVEKPLCITIEDADAICERARTKKRVVQVGYMKRYSQAYTSLLQALPPNADDLRLIDVVTYDPWMAREPFVPWSRMVTADDIPAKTIEAAAAEECRQVARAVGHDDQDSVRAYSYTFLACLVHDVNLVHGVLDQLGSTGSVTPRESAVWAGGNAATASFRLLGDAIWRTSWMLLPGLMEFEERARVYFDDAIHEVVFPAPYLAGAPIEHRVTSGDRGTSAQSVHSFLDDPYVNELTHFYSCITTGEVCRTPPEQARRDLSALHDLYLHRDKP